MFSERIESLSQQIDPQHPMISLYINVTPPNDYRSVVNSLIHQKSNELETDHRYSKNQVKKLRTTLEKIESFFRHNLQKIEGTRMIILFADTAGNWEEFRLPVAVPSRMVIEPQPYIRPLTLLANKFEKYGVLLVSNRYARFFCFSLGEIEEYSDVFIEDYVPDNVHVNISVTYSKGEGVQSGLGEPRAQRHIEDHIQRHLKHVADQTFELYKQKQFSHLIIGGIEDKIIPWLKNHLHSYLQSIIVGEMNIHPDRNDADIKEKVLEVVKQYEWHEEKKILEQLEEQNYVGGKAVLGLEATIRALMMGQIHTLVIRNDFRTAGYLCPNDHCLSTEATECRMCNGEMIYTADLAEAIIEEALNQNAEIRQIVWNSQQFDEHGIGAILRFSLP